MNGCAHARLLAAVMVALVAIGASSGGATHDRSAELRVVPAVLDLGARWAGSSTTATAWVVNTGAEAIEVSGVVSDCLNVQASLARTTIAPATAAPIELRVGVPRQQGGVRRCTTRLLAADGTVLAELPVRFEPAPADGPYAAAFDVPGSMQLVPGVIDFGPVPPGAERSAELWLVNTLDEPLRIDEIRTSCGCAGVDGFEPGTLAPHGVRRMTVSMKASRTPDRAKRARITAISSEGELMRAFVWIEPVDPLVAQLHAYRAARRSDDVETLRSVLAEDSRIWFGKREGPGAPRTATGGGPWSGWDEELGAATSMSEVTVDGRTVTAIVTETNDYYRLLEREPARMRATYWFDEDDRIEGFLIEGLGERSSGRRDAFMAWAGAERPDEMAPLLDDEGDIVPSAENARTWRRLLLAWREAEGLPVPVLPEWYARLDRSLQTMLTARDQETLRSVVAEDVRIGERTGGDAVRALYEAVGGSRDAMELRSLEFEGTRARVKLEGAEALGELLGGEGREALELEVRFDERGRVAGVGTG